MCSKGVLKLIAALACVSCLLVAGCATSGGKPNYSKTLAPDARIIAADKVAAEVTTSSNVTIANYEKERFAQKIEVAIRNRAPQGSRAPRSYRVIVHLTKYEKGNAFARAMLAGLGQMHIDATVTVLAMPAKTPVTEFTMDKTFSWGGMYGAVTNIETVEEEFGKSLADGICAPIKK